MSRAIDCRDNALSPDMQTEESVLPVSFDGRSRGERVQTPRRNNAFEADIAYWREKLSGAPPVLELPTDHPRPTTRTFRSAKLPVRLPQSLTGRLERLSQEDGTTPFVTLLAAFKALLFRYTGQDDLLVGSQTTRQSEARSQGEDRLLTNTLVIRADLSGDPSFRDLLKRVRDTVKDAVEHQKLPFIDLVETLWPNCDGTQPPPLQVMFALEQSPFCSPESHSTGSYAEVDKGIIPFELILELSHTATGLSGWLQYATELFDAPTVARMLGHWETLLASIVTDPEQRLSELSILTESERRQLLVEWNNTKADYPKELCAHHLFEAQVEQTPEAVALIFGEQRLTYRELNRRANQLAHHLQSLGVGAEVLVGICVRRSLEMVVGLLGILKAGGAYVPLDPSYPKERLAFTIQDARMPLLLTQQRLVNALPEHGARVICLDAEWEVIAAASEENPRCKVTPQNLAYVIYTSGSTGRPKGAMIPHQGLVNYLTWSTKAYKVAEGPGTPVHSPLGFDLTITSLFPSLLVGRFVMLLPEDTGIEALSAALREADNFSLVKITPAHLVMLSQSLNEEEVAGRARAMIIGGEALSWEMLAFWRTHAPDTRLINEYGPTETVVGCCIYEAPAGDFRTGAVPIGRPIANTQLYVLDPHMQPVPVGVAGELYIGGDGVGRGYLNRPELTREKFGPDPFLGMPGAQLYKTGDLARYLPDGNLEFLGRIDNQEKIRGFRIELGEIEAVLRQHHSVKETVVLVREDQPGDKRLAAYLVLAPGTSAATDELRDYLKGILPEYMVPSSFVVVEAIPLTPNGKVDRRALPVPDQGRPEMEGAYVAPQDLLEIRLARIWEEVLGVRPIGVRDSFFDLGGHSLTAARLFARIQLAFGKRLPLATLLQTPTIEQLATVLRDSASPAEWSSLVPIQPVGTRHPFFCVHPIGGNVLCYRDLARALGPHQPFYGIQAQGLDRRQTLHTRVEEMAAHYVKEIRLIQPEGPYYLSGQSAGGVVAFEMARQLQRQGERVGLLALLDSTAPGYSHSMPISRRVPSHVSQLMRLRPREKLTYVLVRARVVAERIEKKAWGLAVSPFRSLKLSLPPVLRNVEKVHRTAQAIYRPESYAGRITLFHAIETQTTLAFDLQLGWGRLAADVEVHRVPGNHTTMVDEPNVRVLAEHLTACLEKAHTEDAGGIDRRLAS